MPTTPSPKILLVGAGNMAKEYAKVLQALKVNFLVVSRGQESALNFEKTTGVSVIIGGLAEWLKNTKGKIPSTVIVTVNEEQLGPSARLLARHQVKTILLEKPGGMNLADLIQTQKSASQKAVKVFVAYNRRFYSSTLKAQEIIKKDGGITSFNFDFTELSDRIRKSKISPAIKKEWLLANSSHILDLAFFLGGWPKKIKTFAGGGIDWHPRASLYVGAGISQKNIPFSYHANWESAGRWGLELMTPKQKLILRPLEKLQSQKVGTMATEELKLDDDLDVKFKPGIYRLLQSFFGNKKNLVTLDQQIEQVKYYNLIEKTN